jgi:hypothetical protein
MGFRVGDIYTDAPILELASEYAKEHTWNDTDGLSESIIL